MKAVRLENTGAPDVLAVRELPVPEPGPDQVLVKVEYAGLNFADVLIRRGEYLTKPTLPVTTGLDLAGRVEKTGANVRHLKRGDRVASMTNAGAHAEYCVTDSSLTFPLPDDIPSDKAVALPIAGMTAYHLCHSLTAPREGDVAAVYSASGGVGSFLTQLSKERGATVIALVGKAEDKESVARGFGADHIVRYRDENVVERIRSLTHGRGAEWIYNAVGGPTLPRDFDAVAPLGTVVLYGGAGGLVKSKELMVALMSNFTKSAALRVYHLTTSIKDDPREHHIGLTRLIVGLQNRRLQALVGGTYDLSDVAAAHTALESGRTVGKLILKADA